MTVDREFWIAAISAAPSVEHAASAAAMAICAASAPSAPKRTVSIGLATAGGVVVEERLHALPSVGKVCEREEHTLGDRHRWSRPRWRRNRRR